MLRISSTPTKVDRNETLKLYGKSMVPEGRERKDNSMIAGYIIMQKLMN